MSAERNEATVRTWVEEAWNNGNMESQRGIFSPSYAWPDLPNEFGSGVDALFTFLQAFRAGFPDLHFEVTHVVANDDHVAWRAVGTGTHAGEFMGMPPTGRSIHAPAIIMSRFEDGLWREDFVCWDQFQMLQQLGAIPAPEAAAV